MVNEASCVVLPQIERGQLMPVRARSVLSATPIRAGKLFALASAEINIGGVFIEIQGIRAIRPATEDIYGPLGDAVLDALIERGIAKRRFATPPLEQLSA